MFGAEFELSKDIGGTMVFYYPVLLFGFTGAPGMFGRIMHAAQVYHRQPPFLFGTSQPPFTMTCLLKMECLSKSK